MKAAIPVYLALFCLFTMIAIGAANPSRTDRRVADEEDESVAAVGKAVAQLTRQVMLQQLFIEEKIRSDADSGIKQVRHNCEGTRNYYGNTHTGARRTIAIHDHSNNIRTVGLGEFIAVLNGVEFRTRHNDYRLFMPSKTSKEWHDTDLIPFPEVPDEVTKLDFDEQITEMREWFKAWQNQDHSVRDYRNYFKAVLCYLEGAWTTETEGIIDEPFPSDRHFVDASNWFDLQEKIRFTSYSGRKDDSENYAYLPTSIMNVSADGIPTYAQWNYRILCHPIERDLPLNRFRVVDELHSRVVAKRTLEQQSGVRAARFQLNPMDTNEWKEGRKRFGLLDKLMTKIPGNDNYLGNLADDAFGDKALTLGRNKLNAAYYHRWFEVSKKGAMGEQRRHRGFADENLFMALTSQPNVAGISFRHCTGPKKHPVCETYDQRWTYAIPLEIIYMTPLMKWNPHNILYKGDYGTDEADTVTADGRNGGKTSETAWNGTNSRRYYRTPDGFFSGEEVETDPADTTASSAGVLNTNDELCIVRATGTRVHLPAIPGVSEDRIRTRYPIYPVHGEGSAVWKELEAMKDILLESKTYGYVFREPLSTSDPPPPGPPETDIILEMTAAAANPPGPHTHEITVSPEEAERMMKRDREKLTFTSTTASGHEHHIIVAYNLIQKKWMIDQCGDGEHDSRLHRCWDEHGKFLAGLTAEE